MRISREQEIQICNYYEAEGMRPSEVAEILGIERPTVVRVLRKYGYQLSRGKVGAIDLFTADQLDELVELYHNSNYRMDELARHFGVSVGALYGVLDHLGVELKRNNPQNVREDRARYDTAVLMYQAGRSYGDIYVETLVSCGTLLKEVRRRGIPTRSQIRRQYLDEQRERLGLPPLPKEERPK